MLGSPSSPLVAGIQAVVVAGLLLFFGYLLVDAFVRARLHPIGKLALAFPALIGFTFVLMLAHVISGGRVLSHPSLVRLVMSVAAVALLVLRSVRARSQNESPPRSRTWIWLVVAVVAASFVASIWPVFRLSPMPATADVQLHTGWAMQIVSGDPVPTATITGDVPNYHPWMFHALVALITQLFPGGHPWTALSVVQVLQAIAVVLALFAAGRELTRRTTGGLGAALFGAFSGGVGFVLLSGVDVAVNPVAGAKGVMEYFGDLVVTRPYNLTFLNLPPPVPRDVALALLASFVFLLVAAYTRRNLLLIAGAGVIAGLIGLTGGETWILAMTIAVVVCFTGLGLPRFKAFGAVVGPAVLVYSAWFLPTLANYLTLGGFVNTTSVEPVVMPFAGFIGAWGLTIPFAVWGLVQAIPRWKEDAGVRIAVGLLAASVAVLLLSRFIPDLLGEGFSTLGSGPRYWLYVYLGAALFAAFGFADIVGRTLVRSKAGAVWIVTGTVAVGLFSPVVASIAVTRTEARAPLYKVTNRSIDPDSKMVPTALLDAGGDGCVVAVPPAFRRAVFAFTGYRHVLWQAGGPGANRAGIRWRDIYKHIPRDGQRVVHNRRLTEGVGPRADWKEIARAYRVNLVVVEAKVAGRPVFRGYPSVKAGFGPADRYVIFQLRECRG
jgi:hypothetical protein